MEIMRQQAVLQLVVVVAPVQLVALGALAHPALAALDPKAVLPGLLLTMPEAVAVADEMKAALLLGLVAQVVAAQVAHQAAQVEQQGQQTPEAVAVAVLPSLAVQVTEEQVVPA